VGEVVEVLLLHQVALAPLVRLAEEQRARRPRRPARRQVERVVDRQRRRAPHVELGRRSREQRVGRDDAVVLAGVERDEVAQAAARLDRVREVVARRPRVLRVAVAQADRLVDARDGRRADLGHEPARQPVRGERDHDVRAQLAQLVEHLAVARLDEGGLDGAGGSGERPAGMLHPPADEREAERS
jgi:hypothetical protein